MKKILLLINFLLFAISCSNKKTTAPEPESVGSGWYIQYQDGFSLFEDIYFINKNVGWVVGTGGNLLKTTDGGTHWQKLSIPTSHKLMSVYFFDENTGFVMGWNQSRFFTEDGGMTWDVKSDGDYLYYKDLHFIDDSTGFALNYGNSKLASTINRGRNWNFYDIKDAMSIHFISNKIGYCVGYQSNISKSINGGLSFTRITPPDNFSFFDHVYFCNENIGWLIGNSTWIIGTKDAGNNWEIQFECKTESNFLNDIYFINDKEGWIVGGQSSNLRQDTGIMHTTDGGTNWIEEDVNLDVELLSVFFIDNDNGWAVGRNGLILKYEQR